MIMFHGSPLMRRVNEIIDHVVEASIYNYWISLRINNFNLRSRKMALLHPLDGYYSFKLYNMQTAFCLILFSFFFDLL